MSYMKTKIVVRMIIIIIKNKSHQWSKLHLSLMWKRNNNNKQKVFIQVSSANLNIWLCIVDRFESKCEMTAIKACKRDVHWDLGFLCLIIIIIVKKKPRTIVAKVKCRIRKWILRDLFFFFFFQFFFLYTQYSVHNVLYTSALTMRQGYLLQLPQFTWVHPNV